MLQSILIGYLGADAESKNANGKDFITFRVANTDKWTDGAGQVHENTTWVDCVINGRNALLPYLKKGQQVYVVGAVSLRVYSSAKDKCMKAGLTINVRQVELLGGKSDDFPSVLYSEDKTTQVAVSKYFFAPQMASQGPDAKEQVFFSGNGQRYIIDKQGWVRKDNSAIE